MYPFKKTIYALLAEDEEEIPDIIPPSTPENLQIAGSTSTSIDIVWDASTDNIDIKWYQIHRKIDAGGYGLVGTSTDPNYTDTGLAVLHTYTYKVMAVDTSDNLSGYSNEASEVL